ncbi:MAG: UTP--glucose-1-phosphate uridylyltransferase [Verrucomicrobia bacterium]|nr:UTP--glucose-1-phosphate uridylyltransferase [Verrucomicrobiota bacterium]
MELSVKIPKKREPAFRLHLQKLAQKLSSCASLAERESLLTREEEVEKFLSHSPFFEQYLNKSGEIERVTLKSIMAIGQGGIVLRIPPQLEAPLEKLEHLTESLGNVERFYAPLGGIVGYHAKVLELLEAKGEARQEGRCSAPEGIDLYQHRKRAEELALIGLQALPKIAVIYPIGGAGDRLNLIDPQTKEPLPAALLPFGGRTLLEGLIRDLEAQEHLYREIYGEKTLTPIVMMTSFEKNNDAYLKSLLEKFHHFGRPKESFFLFSQEQVPVITVEGNWSLRAPLEPCFKPGGHGVLWKMMFDAKVFEWLEGWGRTHALLRQINNPVAGIDLGILALLGEGMRGNYTFGFAACQRRVGAPEGTLVHFERTDGEHGISDIEYVQFSQYGLQDAPVSQGSLYSQYPANTNILFLELNAIAGQAKQHPLPGLLINMKNETPFLDEEGHLTQVKGGRLETTVQNIAEHLYSKKEEPLSSFVTFNLRRKTLSVTKKFWKPGEPIFDTPEGAYFDGLHNAYELLHDYCQMELPAPGTMEEYEAHLRGELERRFLHFSYHPALGPSFSKIATKIRGGKIAKGAEWMLEIADVEIEGLQLEGSLRVIAQAPLGSAKCRLKNVTVRNQGLQDTQEHSYWKGQILRSESLLILIEGNGYLDAEGITFEGNETITVSDQTCLRLRKHSREILSRDEC